MAIKLFSSDAPPVTTIVERLLQSKTTEKEKLLSAVLAGQYLGVYRNNRPQMDQDEVQAMHRAMLILELALGEGNKPLRIFDDVKDMCAQDMGMVREVNKPSELER